MSIESEQRTESIPSRHVSPFDRIVAVTDGAATGRAAVETAVELAAECGATVDALYVVDTVREWDIVVERAETEGEAAVEAAADRGATAGVDVRKQFRYGSTHEEIRDFAGAHDVDLVVVGSEPRTGLDRLTNPETLVPRVRRSIEAPLLVVDPDDKATAET